MPLVSRPPWLWPHAAYIHVPFCAFHCGYCDFAVAVGRDDAIDAYLDALDREMSRLQTPQRVETLFFGGGTPTYLGAGQLERLLAIVLKWLPLAEGHEFSVEANPGTLTPDKIRILADHGVNRLSLGAQSFAPHLLKVLERDHAPPDVARAFAQARSHIANISLDLIFGVPGQTLEDWDNDLRLALDLQPAHIATYGLTFEKGTRLWKQRQAGQVQSLDENAELDMYLRAMDVLGAAGFEHYEISNFARPGHRCRHNETYWANHAYHGFGMGAASYVDGVRQTNVRELGAYLKRVAEGRPIHFQSERLPPLARAWETIAVQLRRREGIVRQSFEVQTGFALDALAGVKIAQLAALDLLAADAASVRLTRRGRCVADGVIADIMADGVASDAGG